MKRKDEIRKEIREIYKKQSDPFHVRGREDMRRIEELMRQLREEGD